jgi:hypothetical protein
MKKNDTQLKIPQRKGKKKKKKHIYTNGGQKSVGVR